MAVAPASRPVSLLFADDEPLMLQAFARAVGSERPGWEVVTVRGVEQAQQVLEARGFHAVVSDILMPGQNGLTLLAYARERHPSMIRVVFSGVVEDFAQDREIKQADLVFTKPALATDIVDALARLLPQI